MDVVENGAGGRDDVARLASQLASLDCSLPVDNSSAHSVGKQQQQGQEGANGNGNGAGALADGSSGGADGAVSLGATQFVSSA